VTATISSIDPRTGQVVEVVATESGQAEVDRVVEAAAGAAAGLAAMGISGRAVLLEAMADGLEAARETLVALADRETALGPVRLNGELSRTAFQLRFFADVIRDGAHLEVIVDHAHDSPMGRIADVRRMLIPVGPIANYAASNFPFAFSTAGGDTAAALAAGCPVVVKLHPSHAALSAAVLAVLVAAARDAGAPDGTIGGAWGREGGSLLVQHPKIRAASFTGSTAGGRHLYNLAAARPDPIPFYGELGSINPVCVTPAAAAERGAEIGDGWAASFTLGNGQFCTKPGVALVPNGPAGDAVRDAALAKIGAFGGGWLLNRSIHAAFAEGVARLRKVPGAVVHTGPAVDGADGFAAMPVLVETTTESLAAFASPLLDECFGPAAVLARYRDEDDLARALARMEGSLTATVHLADGETELPARLLAIAQDKAGRLLVNGYPTGVGVTWAMEHGGPWPATTGLGQTSVGATSIRRFLRPVAYQSVPESLLPAELRDDNPLGIPRRVDGRLELGREA
jgi:NADP-dependent aldehyde dehydrogenase